MTNAQIKAYYERLLADHGPTYRAGDYGSAESQKARLTILAEGMDDDKRPLSVLDVGCGIGDFSTYLPAGVTYTGWDFSPLIIDAARRLYATRTFDVRDLITSTETNAFDYVVASGLFQFRGLTYLKRAVTRMFALARQGVTVNVLTTKTLAEEIVHDPFTVGRFARTLGRVIVRTDYKKNDATLVVFKD